MLKKFSLPLVLIVLLIILIVSPDFKEIASWVAIFLFWMRFLQEWFKSFTWWSFEKLLQKSTDKTWKWMIFWFSASSIMQSSSLVSIITVSFLSAWLISLIQGISIIMGSALWNTTWIWLIAGFWMKMNIATLGMPLLVLWIICVFQKSKIIKWIWNIFAWLGFVFLWIHYMKVWFESFSSTIDLTQFTVEWYLWVIIFSLVWLFMTIIMQSSHATIMLVLAALATWQVSFENALALTIWANLWTSATSFIVALTWNKDWKRVWLSDLLMKSAASLILIVFFYQFFWLNELLAKILHIPLDNYPLKLALYHTLFNVVWVAIMLVWIEQIMVILKKVFPDEKNNVFGSIYLNKESIELPSIALISLIKETRHLYYNTIEVVLESLWLKYSDISGTVSFDDLKKKIKVAEIEDMDNLYNKKIKTLYWEILDFATNAEAVNDEKYSEDFKRIRTASRDIVEVVKRVKYVQKNLKRYLRSTNPNIKEQYENIVRELITIIKDISKMQNAESPQEKLLLFTNIKRFIKEVNIVNNWTLDKLIREGKISNEMASSLMNDSNHKKDMLSKLLNSSHVIYNIEIDKEIADIEEKWILQSDFWLTRRQITKMINDYKKQLPKLKEDYTVEEDEIKKLDLNRQIINIEYFIKRYEKNKSVS